jgi:hypothetical protein
VKDIVRYSGSWWAVTALAVFMIVAGLVYFNV